MHVNLNWIKNAYCARAWDSKKSFRRTFNFEFEWQILIKSKMCSNNFQIWYINNAVLNVCNLMYKMNSKRLAYEMRIVLNFVKIKLLVEHEITDVIKNITLNSVGSNVCENNFIVRKHKYYLKTFVKWWLLKIKIYVGQNENVDVWIVNNVTCKNVGSEKHHTTKYEL